LFGISIFGIRVLDVQEMINLFLRGSLVANSFLPVRV